MVSQSMADPRFRQRKVPIKLLFGIVKEAEYASSLEDESRNQSSNLVTGVDEKEEVVSIPHSSYFVLIRRDLFT
jgi:hypothetical protein